MRNSVLFLTLTLILALPSAAQTVVRPGGGIQGGPGRITSPLPGTPGVSSSRPAPAAPDARLGAGGVHANTGNIVYPGTPGGGARPGSIITPGTPAAQPIPSVVQPAAREPRPGVGNIGEKGRGHHRGRRLVGAYPIYGVYAYPAVPNVIGVSGSTITRSGGGYVVTVGGDEPQPDTPPQEIPVDATGEPAYWLIALRGGLIYAVSDYVIEDRAFRFVTLQGDEYVVPIAELDRDFTAKLNRDRGVQIDLD